MTRPTTQAHAAIAESAASHADQLELGLRSEVPRGVGVRISEDGAYTHGRTSPDRRLPWQRDLTLLAVAVFGALMLSASPAWAAGAGATMPWDGPLQALVDNLTGITARALVTIAVVGAGLLWAFTRHEEGMKKLGQIAFGGAIALGAVTLMASLGFAGATF